MSCSDNKPATPAQRLLPNRALPPYAYLPGQTPHPTRDHDGHSFAVEPDAPDAPAPPDAENWRSCHDYLYGIDLFNYGYCWEAHEAWEGLWIACGRQGTQAIFLQALINLAATGFKARWGSARGMQANARTAARLFQAAAQQLGPKSKCYMGFDVHALAAQAKALRDRPLAVNPEAPGALPFDLVLRPE